jgi:hypothetical protein
MRAVAPSSDQLNAKKESLAGLERARLARPVRFRGAFVARNQGAYFSLAFTGTCATPFGSAGFTGFLRGEQRGGLACVGWSGNGSRLGETRRRYRRRASP